MHRSRVGKKGPHRAKHHRVHHQFARGRGTGYQRTCAARVATVVDVTTVSRRGHERFHLAVETVEQISIDDAVNNGVAVLLNVRRDLGGRRVRREMMEAHGSDTRKWA